MANGIFKLRQQIRGLTQGAWTGQKTPAVEYLVVAGGGGGGTDRGGGGGAGGLLAGLYPVSSTYGTPITVTVGGGGSTSPGGGNPTTGNGQNSVFGRITAIAGGGGQGGDAAGTGGYLIGASGGSGGGASTGSYTGGRIQGGQGTFGQGNKGGKSGDHATPGYNSGGGGGAGSVGGMAVQGNLCGNGGQGVASVITGNITTYAGGGGGGAYAATDTQASNGGAGGGGAGKTGTAGQAATAGTVNTGGGGGGGGGASGAGGAGGSGVVVVSYPDVYANAVSTLNATYSTTGSGSLSYNGSTQFLSTVTNTASFEFGTGDFTVETWVYLNNTTGTQIIYDSRASGTSDTTPTLYLASGSLTYYSGGSDRIIGGALSTGIWYHVALVKISGSTKLYLNGSQTGSTYADSNTYINSAGRPTIGAMSFNLGNSPVNGYLSNVRVVKGVGVYTGTFTPSIIPLSITQPAGTNIAAITGTSTSLLLNCVSGAYLADSSTLADTFTTTAAPTWNQLSPFATGLGYKNRVYKWTSSGTITF